MMKIMSKFLAVVFLLIAAPAFSTEYVVKEGDTLSSIRGRLNKVCTVKRLAGLSGIKDPNRIHPGQRIRCLTEQEIAAREVALQWFLARQGVHVVVGQLPEHATFIPGIVNIVPAPPEFPVGCLAGSGCASVGPPLW